MWNYTEKVMDHFLNPRNVGEIDDADGIGDVGNLVCGDAMKLFVKIADDKKTIKEVKFRTFGCASAIASASALTEMLHGKTIEEAVQFTNQDIADYLGDLPEAKMHCSVMGMEAFQAALKDMHLRHPEIPLPKNMPEEFQDKIICHCFNVTETQIRNAVKTNHLKTVEQVTNFCKAGGSCGKCKGDIQKIINEIVPPEPATALACSCNESSSGCTNFKTNLERIEKIQNVFDKVVRPALKQDDGDAELVDVKKNVVLVRLLGHCASCPTANITFKNWIEKILHDEVSEAIVVKRAE
ncbi:MAG: Fe-S cluster assembly protein NifU [Lentisphaeria bacterium]